MLMAVPILFVFLTNQNPKDASNGSKYNNDYIENCLSFKYKQEKIIAIANWLKGDQLQCLLKCVTDDDNKREI